MAWGMGALLGLSALGTAGQLFEQDNAAKMQEGELQNYGMQQQLSYDQQQTAAYKQMQTNISSSMAHASTTGLLANSPSFNAIARNQYNIGAQTAGNLQAEASIAQQNIGYEEQNVQNSLYGNIFGDLGQFAQSAAFASRMMPS